MVARLSGGCECGAVRYEIATKPLSMFKCHCHTCQKVTGGPYVPVVVVPAKALKFTRGSPRYHFTDRIVGDGHKRGFCADCGSRLTGAQSAEPSRIVAVTASSLDDPSIFKAEFDIFTSHAQPWDAMDPALPKFEQYPPR